MHPQPRSGDGRFATHASSESHASLAGGFDPAQASHSAASDRLARMDHGADPRQFLNDKDTLVRISAASRSGTEVQERDREVAELIAA